LRYAYYGAWMPNTAYGNGAFTLQRLYRGLLYDIDGVGSQIVFLLLAIVGCVALSIAGKTRQVILLGTVCVGWLLYVMTIGGDVFPSYRHFVPVMALMGFLVAGCGLLTLAAPFRFSMARVVTFLLLTLLVLTSDLLATTVQGDRPGKPIGLFLHTEFTARDSLSAGCEVDRMYLC
jgi:arabinofuranosyltransferase